MRRSWPRRSLLAWLGGTLAGAGLLAACGRPPQPATRAAPTLVPTALPTAEPASAGRASATPTPDLTGAFVSRTPPARPTSTGTPARAAMRAVTVLQSAELTTLDPHAVSLPSGGTVSSALFDTLTVRGADQSVIGPMLAAAWRVRDRRWEVRLRPSVTFHTGDTLSSADVRFSIERTIDLRRRSAVASLFATVERIETPDPLTVVFVTRQPDPLLPARLAASGAQIVPKRYVEQIGDGSFAARPVGTGPFRFVERRTDGAVVLERVEGYWGGPPLVERLVVAGRPEAAARVAALVGSDAQLVTDVPADLIETIARSGSARVEGALANGLYVLAVNARVPPLDNPLLKQALSLAIDREQIIRMVHHGQGVVPNGLIAQGEFGFDATLPPLEYNPERARARLQAAGYRGEQIVLETTQGSLAGDREMARLIAEMWRKVGIACRVDVIDLATQAQQARDRAFAGLWWADPTSPLLDPDGMMYRLLGPDAAPRVWRDPEWDRLGAEARASLDQALRLRNYRRMNEIALEQLPWIPILQPRRLYGVAGGIDFAASGTGTVNPRRERLKPRG